MKNHTISTSYQYGKTVADIDIDLSRLPEAEKKARYILSQRIFQSCVRFMPMVTGTFIKRTQMINDSLAGTGYVCVAAPPYGRFLYEGKGMVGIDSGSPWAQSGEMKVLVSEYGGETSAAEYLTFDRTAHPNAQDHWFEAAKSADMEQWCKAVEEAWQN